MRGTRSILFRTQIRGAGRRLRGARGRSGLPPPDGTVTSTTSRRTSSSRSASCASATMDLFSRWSGLWSPGVSTNTICPSSSFRIPRRLRRVVCGLSDTIATFVPTSAFTSVDFPAFGRPTTATVPERERLHSVPAPPSSRGGGASRRTRTRWIRRRSASSTVNESPASCATSPGFGMRPSFSETRPATVSYSAGGKTHVEQRRDLGDAHAARHRPRTVALRDDGRLPRPRARPRSRRRAPRRGLPASRGPSRPRTRPRRSRADGGGGGSPRGASRPSGTPARRTPRARSGARWPAGPARRSTVKTSLTWTIPTGLSIAALHEREARELRLHEEVGDLVERRVGLGEDDVRARTS